MGLAVVFAHNPKSGGTSLKLMTRSLCIEYDWHCDEFMPSRGWMRTTRQDPKTRVVGTVDDWFNQSTLQKARTRIVLSAMPDIFIGVCQVLPRPCVYVSCFLSARFRSSQALDPPQVTTMRAPLDQLWSSYHYFCILGMEDRHMWTEDQKNKGVCDTPLRNWYIPDVCRKFLATPETPQDDLQPAVAALEHPCMWTLDSITLDADIVRMSSHFPFPWNQVVHHLAHANVHRDGRRPESTTKPGEFLATESYYAEMARRIPPSDAQILLQNRLAPHARCYAMYRSIREEMFARPADPLVTC